MMEWVRGRRDARRAERREESEMGDEHEVDRKPEVLDLTNARASDAAAASAPAAAGGAPTSKGLSPAMQIRDRVVAVLKTVYDPEIPVDIYELGLVYGIDVSDDGDVHVTMTLTTPMCPVAETLPPEVEEKVRNVIGVKDVVLDLVWDPPWSMDMLSDSARLELNLM